MKRYIQAFWAVMLAVALLSSCGRQDENSLFWGQTRQYSDFLFKKYIPSRMEQTLVFEFNEDALRQWDDVLTFELIDINTKRKIEDIILYKNGEICKDNLLNITAADKEVVVGIEFRPSAPEGRYMLALQPKSLNGLDRIDAIELEHGIVIEKEDVMNPLAKGSMFVLTVIVIVLLVWIIIAHLFVNPSTCFNRVYFDYGSGAGRPIRMGSAYKLVCTNKLKKTSFLTKLFVGDVRYEVNEFWDKDFVITNGVRRRQVRFEGRASYRVDPDRVMKGDSFAVTNSKDETVKIQL